MAGLHSSDFIYTIWLEVADCTIWLDYSSGFMKFVQYGWITQ